MMGNSHSYLTIPCVQQFSHFLGTFFPFCRCTPDNCSGLFAICSLESAQLLPWHKTSLSNLLRAPSSANHPSRQALLPSSSEMRPPRSIADVRGIPSTMPVRGARPSCRQLRASHPPFRASPADANTSPKTGLIGDDRCSLLFLKPRVWVCRCVYQQIARR